jgi:hypothetical protein
LPERELAQFSYLVNTESRASQSPRRRLRDSGGTLQSVW